MVSFGRTRCDTTYAEQLFTNQDMLIVLVSALGFFGMVMNYLSTWCKYADKAYLLKPIRT